MNATLRVGMMVDNRKLLHPVRVQGRNVFLPTRRTRHHRIPRTTGPVMVSNACHFALFVVTAALSWTGHCPLRPSPTRCSLDCGRRALHPDFCIRRPETRCCENRDTAAGTLET